MAFTVFSGPPLTLPRFMQKSRKKINKGVMYLEKGYSHNSKTFNKHHSNKEILSNFWVFLENYFFHSSGFFGFFVPLSVFYHSYWN